jgi:hypothetical protein
MLRRTSRRLFAAVVAAMAISTGSSFGAELPLAEVPPPPLPPVPETDPIELPIITAPGTGGAELDEPAPATAHFDSPTHADPPADAPTRVQRAVRAANAIARKPYLWGGGHTSFSDSGYDCSGAVSYVLRGARLLTRPLASTALMTWGRRGRGEWITVFASPAHAYVEVAGLRFDTAGPGPSGPRWRQTGTSRRGFRARHARGL